MKTKLKFLILLSLVVCVVLTSCDSAAKRERKARALYEEGVRLREQRLSTEAAECFMKALAIVGDNNIKLVADIKDNLGAMYNKHGMFEDALLLHGEAAEAYKQLNDSIGMMTALRNCGRSSKSLGLYSNTKHYYDSAFQIATLINNKEMQNDLYLEMGRDYYMEVENYPKAIEYVSLAMQGGLQGNDLDIANMTLGILYYYIDKNDIAKSYLEKALQSDRAGVRMSVYQTLYGIALNEENLEKAMEYEELFIKNMQLLETENNIEAMQRLKAEYELKAQKSQMESVNRIKSLKLYLVIAIVIIASLTVLLIIRKRIADNKIRVLEKELKMRNKVMLSNKVFMTAKNLDDHITAEAMKFQLDDSDWQDFINLTDLVYDGFSQRLLQMFPKLGKWDVRICCLSKNGFSNQVISILLDTQTDSYYKRKTRIKQMKMELNDDTRSFEEIVNAV